MIKIAVGIISSEYENPSEFIDALIDPISKFGLKQENPAIRYYSVEYLVNLILIMRENIFPSCLLFFNLLLDVTLFLI